LGKQRGRLRDPHCGTGRHRNACGSDRRRFGEEGDFLHRAPGPRGPGRHYAASPGLVFWVNREVVYETHIVVRADIDLPVAATATG